jgi:hypothetical protein
MIPTSSKTMKKTSNIDRYLPFWRCFKERLYQPSFIFSRDKSLTAVQVFKSKLSPFTMSIPIQFGHLKLWQNTQDSHFSIPL